MTLPAVPTYPSLLSRKFYYIKCYFIMYLIGSKTVNIYKYNELIFTFLINSSLSGTDSWFLSSMYRTASFKLFISNHQRSNAFSANFGYINFKLCLNFVSLSLVSDNTNFNSFTVSNSAGGQSSHIHISLMYLAKKLSLLLSFGNCKSLVRCIYLVSASLVICFQYKFN